jgi:hypothetical protein
MGDPYLGIIQDGGGGLYVHAAGGVITLHLRDSTITKNASRLTGGGGAFVGASHHGTTDVTFDRVAFTENRVSYAGALEVIAGSSDNVGAPAATTVSVVNSLLADNRAEGSAALHVLGFDGPATVLLHSSTITRNSGTPDAGEDPEGAIVLNRGSATITNTIVWGNTTTPAAAGRDLQVGDRAIARVDHSDIGDGIAVPTLGGQLQDLGGNIQAPPLLIGVRLDPSSPLIDAGTCIGGPTVDFEGDPRPTGTGCDIGWDEVVR